MSHNATDRVGLATVQINRGSGSMHVNKPPHSPTTTIIIDYASEIT